MRFCYIKVYDKGNKRRSGTRYISLYYFNRNSFTGFHYAFENEEAKKVKISEETLEELIQLGGKRFIKRRYVIEWLKEDIVK